MKKLLALILFIWCNGSIAQYPNLKIVEKARFDTIHWTVDTTGNWVGRIYKDSIVFISYIPKNKKYVTKKRNTKQKPTGKRN